MAKRTPTGKPRPGEQRSQQLIRTGLVTFTGSTVVDLQRAIRSKGATPTRKEEIAFEVMSLNFEDAGGVATVTRLSSQKNGDGTFTINASKDTGAAGVLAVATTACTVRWTVLVTN